MALALCRRFLPNRYFMIASNAARTEVAHPFHIRGVARLSRAPQLQAFGAH
jgi:hypothetical protein